jgi:DNA-binding CsgD family transcriptional regulator
MMSGVIDTTFLDEIYATALDARGWESVLGRFADMVGGSSGFLSAFDLVSGTGAVILSRCDPESLAAYEEHYAAINPLHNVADPGAFLRDWRPTILTDEDQLPKDEYVRTEYYNDFVLPNDSHSAMMIRLGRHGSAPQVLNINRRRERGSFEAADLEIAAFYHPHFIRAFELGQKLAMSGPPDDDLAFLFAGSSHSLFVTNADGRIVRANPLAESLLTGSAGLRAIGGRLTCDQADAGRRLTALIAAAACDGERRKGGSMVLAVSDGRPPLSITVVPLGTPGHPIFNGAPRVLVCATDPSRDVPLPEHRLRDVFGLTGAEARVALALVDCGDLPTAAVKLGIASNTARIHLARIYDKTGVNRQIALAKLVLRCAGPDIGT